MVILLRSGVGNGFSNLLETRDREAVGFYSRDLDKYYSPQDSGRFTQVYSIDFYARDLDKYSSRKYEGVQGYRRLNPYYYYRDIETSAVSDLKMYSCKSTVVGRDLFKYSSLIYKDGCRRP